MDLSTDYEENFLQKLDIFGIGISIRFRKNSEHTTKFGGIMTVAIFSVMIIQISLIFTAFIDSSNPTLLYEQKFTEQPGKYHLSPDTFSFAFGLQDLKTEKFLDHSYYFSTLIMHTEQIKETNKMNQKKEIVKTQRKIKLQKCLENDFKIQETKDYFQSLDLDYLYCIDKSEVDVFIEGQKDSDKYVWLQVKIEFCDQADQCDIQQFPYNRLVIYYSDHAIVPSSRYSPIKTIGAQIYWNSSLNFSKQLQMQFRDTLLQTDTGFLIQDIKNKNTFKYSKQVLQTTNLIDQSLYEVSIAMESNFQDQYRRSYPKLDRAFSQIGGTFNVLFTIGALICKPISQVDLNRKLINRIFNFEDKDDQETKEKKAKKPRKESIKTSTIEGNNNLEHSLTQKVEHKSSIKMQQLNIDYSQSPDSVKEGNTQKQIIDKPVDISNTDSPIINMLAASKKIHTLKKSSLSLYSDLRDRSPSHFFQSREQTQINNNIATSFNNTSNNKSEKNANKIEQSDELEKFFNQHNNHIRFKNWEHFANFFKFSNFCRTRKQKLLQKGVDKLYNHIDIFYLIQKLIEIEKLKHLLLNENQIKLFEFIPKPLLTTQEKRCENLSDKVGLLYHGTKNLVERRAEAKKAFIKIVNEQQKISKIDVRIMELLDPKFKSLIKEFDIAEQLSVQRSAEQTQFNSENEQGVLNIIQKKPPSLEENNTIADNQLNEIGYEATSENLIQRGVQYKLKNFTLDQYTKETKLNEISHIQRCQSTDIQQVKK